jgi:hypothetical protein
MQFSTEGDVITPGEEPQLAPGVRGIAFDTPTGIYIPLVRAEQRGAGAVSRFLDSLPKDRRVVFPCVISRRLGEMLLRRGFFLGLEEDTHLGGRVDVMQRCPVAASEVSK